MASNQDIIILDIEEGQVIKEKEGLFKYLKSFVISQ